MGVGTSRINGCTYMDILHIVYTLAKGILIMA